jgi:hypothetical protein
VTDPRPLLGRFDAASFTDAHASPPLR